MVHLEPVVLTVRWYDDADGWTQRKPYKAVATVQIMGEHAWVSALHGTMTPRMWRELEAEMLTRGVRIGEAIRRGRKRTLLWV